MCSKEDWKELALTLAEAILCYMGSLRDKASAEVVQHAYFKVDKAITAIFHAEEIEEEQNETYASLRRLP